MATECFNVVGNSILSLDFHLSQQWRLCVPQILGCTSRISKTLILDVYDTELLRESKREMTHAGRGEHPTSFAIAAC